MFFSFKDSFLPFTWAKISEFFALHVHCGLLLQGHVRKLVKFLLASRPIAVCALSIVRHFLLDIVEKRIHLFLSFAGSVLIGVFLFILVTIFFKVATILCVVCGIGYMQDAVELILGIVV